MKPTLPRTHWTAARLANFLRPQEVRDEPQPQLGVEYNANVIEAILKRLGSR